MKRILPYLFLLTILLSPGLSMADGNNALGPIYSASSCGLNYAVQSVRLGLRFLPSGLPQPAALNITGMPQCAVVAKAFLWAEGSGNGAPQTATINGPLGATSFPMSVVGTGPDKCWTYQGSYTYRADVTSAIVGNGTYYISGLATNPTNIPTGNDMDGATLMIIYGDPSASWIGNIAINDGALVGLINNVPTANQAFTQYTMNYPAVCGTPSNGVAFMAVGDLQNNTGHATLNGIPAVYTYNWWNYLSVNTNFTTGQSSSLFSVIGDGDCYNIAITGMYYRNNTCLSCPTLNQSLVVTGSSTPTQCNSCNGTATVNIVTGTPPYTYSWAPSGGNNSTAANLCAGTYTCTVTGGCVTAYDTIVVNNNGSSFTVNQTQTDAQCYNICNGTATITSVNGGIPPYTYSWQPTGGNAATASNLCPGTYTCTVSDANNCPYAQVFTISSPQAITVSSTSTSPKCFGGNGGLAQVNVLGGLPPYTYTWSPAVSTGPFANNLASGSYTCTITDFNGCTYEDSFAITTPPELTADIHRQNVVCQSKNDGYAIAVATGGTPPYTYSWAPVPGTDTIIDNLPVGQYSVTITDSNNCTYKHTFNIFDTSLPFTYLITDSSIDCRSAWLDAFPATGSSLATDYLWIFDTTTVPGHPVVHTFPQPGFNTAGLVVVNAVGCHDTLSHTFTIDYPMVADFSFDPQVPIPNTATNFHNKSSSYATIFSWDFGDHTYSTEENPVKAYSDSGSYHICLIASDSNNCADSICKDLVADVDKGIDIPSAFSPNGDGINDVLLIRGSKLALKSVHLRIFNRWGNVIFETDSKDKGWDGTYKGKPQEEESYGFVLEGTFTDGTSMKKMGSVTLLR